MPRHELALQICLRWCRFQTTYSYDSVYRLTHEALAVTDPVSPQSSANVGYTLDDVGNRLARSSTLPSVAPQTLTFDANDRLEWDSYDSNGNTVGGQVTNGWASGQ